MGNPKKCTTGNQVKKKILPVRLIGFEHPEKIVTQSLNVSIDYFSVHIEENLDYIGKLGRAEIEGEYIYVFRKGPSGWWLRYELHTSGTGGFNGVPWGKTYKESVQAREKYRPSEDGTHELRKLDSELLDGDEIPLDVSRQHVIFRSRYQLPYHRIEAYRSNEWLLRSRGVTLPAESTASSVADVDLDHALVYVPDLISVAEAFHEEYIDALARLRKKMTPLKTKKRLLAGLIQGVVEENPELKTHLRDGEVDRYLEEVTRSLKEDKQLVKSAAAQHRACITMEGFEAALDDLTGKKFYEEKAQEIYADLLRGLPEHREGLETLQEIASLPDGWAHRLLLSPEEFQFISESVNAANELEDIAVKFFLGRAFHHLEQAEESIQHIAGDLKSFKEAYENYDRFSASTHVALVEDKRGTNQILKITSEEAAGISPGYARNREWAQSVKKLDLPLQKLVLIAEMINLTDAWSEFVKSVQEKGADEVAMSSVNLMGSAAASFEAAKELLETNAGQSVIASKSGSVLKAGVIGVICDYTSGVVEAYRASAEGNLGTSVGHGLTALGAVSFGTAMALEGGLLSSGSYVAATATSIGTGGLTLIGALLFAGGTFVISFYTQAPLEKYLRSCPWGKESEYRNYSISGISESQLEEDIKELLKLLWQPNLRVTSDPKDGNIHLSLLTPLYINKETKIGLELRVLQQPKSEEIEQSTAELQPSMLKDLQTEVIYGGSLQLPDSQTSVSRENGGFILHRAVSVDGESLQTDSGHQLVFSASLESKLTQYDKSHSHYQYDEVR